ncbi:MAG: ABC transporter ATP-binding protein [Planctomycetota bacterium]|nr:ABC transporter ATP-binding protein [Planctomycetota bacterium]
MSILELNGILRSYERGIPVLENVDLSIEAGEVVGLLGENGAGKTTLIKIALGLLHPQEGTVRLFGKDPTVHPVATKRRVGYVSENQVLPPQLRIIDVLAMHRELFSSWDEAVELDLLDRFEFTGRERIGKLSKGQARRVAVICAITHRPELLLLDEPAGGFDPAARREFLEVALQFLANEGSAILFSSHQMNDVERIASRICMLRRGQKIIDQSLDSLQESAILVTAGGGTTAHLQSMRDIQGCLSARLSNGELRSVIMGSRLEVDQRLTSAIRENEPRLSAISLEELFIELVEGRP